MPMIQAGRILTEIAVILKLAKVSQCKKDTAQMQIIFVEVSRFSKMCNLTSSCLASQIKGSNVTCAETWSKKLTLVV